MYNGALLNLHKMMKPQVELGTRVRSETMRNSHRSSLVVRKYGTSSIGMLIKAKEKNQVKLELDVYFD